MTLNVAVQMDHISGINIRGDSTFALMLEARAPRPHALPLHAEPARAARRARRGARRAGAGARPEGRPFHARRRRSSPTSPASTWCCLRQDPPFDMAYITTTHLLERIHPEDAGRQRSGACAQRAGKALRHRVPGADAADADHPRRRGDPRASARSTATSSSSRSTAMAAPACSASPRATRISRRCSRSSPPPSASRMSCSATCRRCARATSASSWSTARSAGAINRVPAEGEARSNMHVGGRPEPTELTEREREICATHRPGAEAARLHLRRHRRDRRLSDRDQRHLADRHPRGEALRRRRHRGAVLGRGGGEGRALTFQPVRAGATSGGQPGLGGSISTTSQAARLGGRPSRTACSV